MKRILSVIAVLFLFGGICSNGFCQESSDEGAKKVIVPKVEVATVEVSEVETGQVCLLNPASGLESCSSLVVSKAQYLNKKQRQ